MASIPRYSIRPRCRLLVVGSLSTLDRNICFYLNELAGDIPALRFQHEELIEFRGEGLSEPVAIQLRLMLIDHDRINTAP